jgi:hypothetical protein
MSAFDPKRKRQARPQSKPQLWPRGRPDNQASAAKIVGAGKPMASAATDKTLQDKAVIIQ